MLGQDLSVSRAGELSTAIGVEDKSLRGTTSAKSHAQSSDGEGGVEDLAHGPANYSPGEDIEDRDEIQPALSGEDGSGIADPDLIGASNCEVLQSVRSNGSTMATVGGGRSIFGALPGKDSLQAHKTGNTVAPSRTAQCVSKPRATVSLATAGKFLSDALTQAAVLQLARSGLSAPLFPVVVTAARNQKRLTQPGYFVLAAHLLDSGISLGGASERMPSDFFITSRCSKSLAFSWRKRRFSASSSSKLRAGLRPALGTLGTRSACAQR